MRFVCYLFSFCDDWIFSFALFVLCCIRHDRVCVSVCLCTDKVVHQFFFLIVEIQHFQFCEMQLRPENNSHNTRQIFFNWNPQYSQHFTVSEMSLLAGENHYLNDKKENKCITQQKQIVKRKKIGECFSRYFNNPATILLLFNNWIESKQSFQEERKKQTWKDFFEKRSSQINTNM